MFIYVLFLIISHSYTINIFDWYDFNPYENGVINGGIRKISPSHCFWLNQHCGKSSFHNGQIMKIHQGHQAQPGHFPWIVHLEILINLTVIPDRTLPDWESKAITSTRVSSCAGTLVSKRHVLTAAHCLYNMEVDNATHEERCTTETKYKAKLMFGVSDLNEREELQEEKARIISPMFKAVKLLDEASHDWAIIQIQWSFKESEMISKGSTIRPVCLPQTNQWLGGSFVVAGWGITDSNEPTPFLQTVHVQREKCLGEGYKPSGGHTKSMEVLCVTALLDKGDSGTAFIQNVNDTSTMVAIDSRNWITPNTSIIVQSLGTLLASADLGSDPTTPLAVIKRYIWP